MTTNTKNLIGNVMADILSWLGENIVCNGLIMLFMELIVQLFREEVDNGSYDTAFMCSLMISLLIFMIGMIVYAFTCEMVNEVNDDIANYYEKKQWLEIQRQES